AVWRLESIGLHAMVKPYAFIGYCWMGFLFLFFCIALSLDIAQLLLKGAVFLFSFVPPALLMNAKSLFLSAMLAALATTGWGFVAARTIHVEQVTVQLPNMPAEAERYRIVQISDIHLGVMTNRQWLDEVIATVNGLQPDLIVATGDIVDSHVDGSREFAEAMRRLQARDGSYAIPGNHEQYAGIERSLHFFREAGFTPLRDEMAKVRPWLTLVGVDDQDRHHVAEAAGPDQELPLLQRARQGGGVVILLKHQPVVAKSSLGLFDLQLSGHAHQGQIYPFRYLTQMVYAVESGLSKLEKGAYLYLSRGTGTWGPPLRVLAPPEITLFEFHHASQ
ncbi:MAG TPA: metallophosphoesterase, partial [Gammaproteobacteria bacterium]